MRDEKREPISGTAFACPIVVTRKLARAHARTWPVTSAHARKRRTRPLARSLRSPYVRAAPESSPRADSGDRYTYICALLPAPNCAAPTCLINSGQRNANCAPAALATARASAQTTCQIARAAKPLEAHVSARKCTHARAPKAQLAPRHLSRRRHWHLWRRPISQSGAPATLSAALHMYLFAAAGERARGHLCMIRARARAHLAPGSQLAALFLHAPTATGPADNCHRRRRPRRRNLWADNHRCTLSIAQPFRGSSHSCARPRSSWRATPRHGRDELRKRCNFHTSRACLPTHYLPTTTITISPIQLRAIGPCSLSSRERRAQLACQLASREEPQHMHTPAHAYSRKRTPLILIASNPQTRTHLFNTYARRAHP